MKLYLVRNGSEMMRVLQGNMVWQLELSRPIPWNQTLDVHRGSTLIM